MKTEKALLSMGFELTTRGPEVGALPFEPPTQFQLCLISTKLKDIVGSSGIGPKGYLKNKKVNGY